MTATLCAATFSNRTVTFCDVNVVWCYVLSQYRFQRPFHSVEIKLFGRLKSIADFYADIDTVALIVDLKTKTCV